MQDLYDAQKKLGKRQVHHFLKFFRCWWKTFFCWVNTSVLLDIRFSHMPSYIFHVWNISHICRCSFSCRHEKPSSAFGGFLRWEKRFSFFEDWNRRFSFFEVFIFHVTVNNQFPFRKCIVSLKFRCIYAFQKILKPLEKNIRFLINMHITQKILHHIKSLSDVFKRIRSLYGRCFQAHL